MVKANVAGRKFTFCETLLGYPLARLIVQCHECDRFFAACCGHCSFGDDWFEEDQRTCHHLQLVFTDGACSNNGRANARAGVGITIGGDDLSWSIPVDDAVDPGVPRTNQRAELLAAIAGLKKLHELNIEQESDAESESEESGLTYILVTDSEYVVKGITEWLPAWRRRNWRTSSGKEPTNLDLFRRLDEYITILEHEDVGVGFWHVPREYNHLADALSKRATAT